LSRGSSRPSIRETQWGPPVCDASSLSLSERCIEEQNGKQSIGKMGDEQLNG
jgi:hypothetical protein